MLDKRSYLSKDKMKIDIITSANQSVKKEWVLWIVSGLKTSPSNLTVVTVLGLTIFLTSLIPALNRITSLAIFIPPPVEPAIAPLMVKNKSMLFARVGQASVSTLLEIPVVELMLVTWNVASFSAVPKLV